MEKTIKLTQLTDVLSDLVPIKDSIPKYVRDAGLKIQHIDTTGSAMNVWNNVLHEADKHHVVDEVVRAVLNIYPENPFLKAALSEQEIDYTLDKDVNPIWHKFENLQLEKLTMEQSTLLPINFLAKGVIKSKAVAKVEIDKGGNMVGKGTGFLIKVKGIDDLFFITNYHVLPDKDKIDKIRIVFDFELDVNDNSVASKSFYIDEEGPWYSSGIHELDTTVCKLKDDENQLKNYGFLELGHTDLPEDKFVNIIQHPGGEMKQISLYHNIITYSDERIVQYLTDTLKGSSGSPVFNSRWEVIALHHSGGEKRNGEVELPKGFKSRNEGIVINPIVEFITSSHGKNN
ncbi:trypsin-like peptidase [Chryseobacterium sp. 52]|uniref:trypsin-like peptidase domain-containing protein n=1 Tax=Chryseobacterium sp. 52 TaxID=2035213 RepID=UPI000C1A646C|nr:trypsin-like peptidase domain-containing protein [Chryseobacterium sp. 52]PIF45482.1 trypsin-like peptidase [Chryseobacterium sp. 52]